MMSRRISTTAFVFLLFAMMVGSVLHLAAQSPTPTTPSTSPTPMSAAKPLPLISYLKDGGLWLMREDGSENRQIVPAPEEDAIANQLWSHDGNRIYFHIGLNLYAYVVSDQKVENLGILDVPAGIALDRIELSTDHQTLLAHTIDANDVLNSVPKIFAVTFQPLTMRELSIDEYQVIAPVQSSVIAKVGDLSVSPDGRFVLFAEAVDRDMQLFVADVETGNRHQVTDLGLLDGFETAAMPDGGRRFLEATWAPDGQHIVFVPAQSCSEFGLCSGKMYLVNAWGGAQLQLATAPAASLSQEWNHERNRMIYDDNGQLVLADEQGQLKALGEGTQPKWQPTS